MSIRVISYVWDFGPDDPIDNSVLVCLAGWGNDDGEQCFPSVARVAARVRRSERTVERSIAVLEAEGWLAVERGVGRGKTSQYHINVSKLEERQADALLEKRQRKLKGDSWTEKATPGPIKGDSHDIPPHPLLGRNVIDSSLESSVTTDSEKIELIWQAYPSTRRDAKKKTFAIIRESVGRLMRGEEEPYPPMGEPEALEMIFIAVQAFARSPAGTAGIYTPLARTWFKQARYTDDPAVWQVTGDRNERNANHRTASAVEAGQRAIAAARRKRADPADEAGGAPQCQPWLAG